MKELGITDAEFARFQRLIHEIAGISLADSKKVLLVGRLGKRLRALQLDSFSRYLDLVTGAGAGNAQERQAMVDLLTTNETYFFREQAHFDYLRNTIVPQHPPQQPLEIWSAAASTGEEIYTLAMVLADCLGVQGAWNILGSDISTQVLATAARGHYWLERTRGLPAEYLHKYCLKGVRSQEGSFLIAPELRRHTRFMQINLNAPLPDIGRFHVVFLRNVMIYFDNHTKREVVARIVQKLHPGGYLIVGHSESLNGINDSVKLVRPTIYRLPPAQART
ncbi:CheR family methyltransferase [Parapusillimonas granuli]|uniref:Chemotaxis protein methyltransferase n=1 Tax=Parapusillimonas granuli TaxID=380911 RepID=A0A853FZN5_9BURK|nr:protein-glutamate O-methyltransferase CheR [Parapusillimonas granuli]MBB5213441.1 chemotaxis protein methyltransferase CheR [Parapusillimonas granuli]MEB2398541.1 protein-glutamate O-methyltransferase CheR [Alcaligenaceae bacterium]NYT48280.1 protein-glutamate O-methyltransferase CheR [Parapusillimonas granuli]